ncbi:MAG: adenylate/guanylate cyclase domain-containing protein [Gammaproteobacteria bacterium]
MSIKQKFTLSFSILIILSVSGFAFLAQQLFQRTLETQASNFAKIIAKQTADSVTELVLANDLLGLNVVLGQLTQEPGFVSATITDVDRHILASTMPPGSSIPTSGRIYSAPITVQDSVAGQVIFVFDDRQMEEPRTRLLYLFASTLAAALLITGVLAWRLCEQITAPILLLLDQAEDFEVGDENATITVDRDDEVGLLQQRVAEIIQHQHHLQEQLAVTGMPDNEPSDVQLQRPERRMASLLVIEMVNSTSAVELLHPATLSTLLQQYQFYLRQASRLYRGVVTQLSGDRAMVAFDVRQCQDEHAFNAICCGQLFLHLMQRLAVMQSGRNAQQLEFRLAVHSGDVFFSPLWKSPKQDKDSSRRETVIGHTVSLVQELLAHASTDQILVSELSFDLANGNLRFPVSPGAGIQTDKRTILTYNIPADCGMHKELLEKQCQHLLPEQTRPQDTTTGSPS